VDIFSEIHRVFQGRVAIRYSNPTPKPTHANCEESWKNGHDAKQRTAKGSTTEWTEGRSVHSMRPSERPIRALTVIIMPNKARRSATNHMTEQQTVQRQQRRRFSFFSSPVPPTKQNTLPITTRQGRRNDSPRSRHHRHQDKGEFERGVPSPAN